jgi:hypothetical protein
MPRSLLAIVVKAARNTVGPLRSLKASLYRALRESGITRAELMRRLGWNRESVDRLFRLDHARALTRSRPPLWRSANRWRWESRKPGAEQPLHECLRQIKLRGGRDDIDTVIRHCVIGTAKPVMPSAQA